MSIQYAIKLETRQIKDPTFPYFRGPISSAKSVVDFARSLQDVSIEKFLVLYLNNKNELNCIQVTEGTLSHAVVYTREVVKHALLSNASAIILVHNHPSEHPEPSEEDKMVTCNIVSACKVLDIRVLDHIIIGGDTHFSFQEMGLTHFF